MFWGKTRHYRKILAYCNNKKYPPYPWDYFKITRLRDIHKLPRGHFDVVVMAVNENSLLIEVFYLLKHYPNSYLAVIGDNWPEARKEEIKNILVGLTNRYNVLSGVEVKMAIREVCAFLIAKQANDKWLQPKIITF